MKLPSIPLPSPVVMITFTRPGPAWRRHAVVHAIRLVLWWTPAIAAEVALLDTGHHSTWLAMGAAYLVFAIAVLLVNVRESAGDDEGDAP